MKKEQIIQLIGESPDAYVADAASRGTKRKSARYKWFGGIAAAVAFVVLVNGILGQCFSISARAVSISAAPRVMARPNANSDKFDIWLEERQTRRDTADAAILPLSAFAAQATSALFPDDSENRNTVWSPVNAYIALAMTAELTDGETRQEVLDALGVENVETLRERISAIWETVYTDNSREISLLANSLWLDQDVDYVQETMDQLAYSYYASVYQGDLGSDKTNRDITAWMKKQTGGMLGNRTGDVQLAAEDQMLTIASTVYFRSKWKDQFQKKNNTQSMFHSNGGDIECTFMNQKENEMYYYWAEDFSAVRMTLENGSSMWMILPDSDKSIADVLENDDYMEMVTSGSSCESVHAKWMKVNLSVPGFDISSGLDLKDGLRKIGINRIFEKYGNDFSGSIVSKQPVYLDNIYQDTRTMIDEEGVAAASYMELNFGAGAAEPPQEIIDFVVDRPFIFVISKSQIPMFIGVVNEP